MTTYGNLADTERTEAAMDAFYTKSHFSQSTGDDNAKAVLPDGQRESRTVHQDNHCPVHD